MLKAEPPLDPVNYLVPQSGRGHTIVQGLTDERAPWLMLQTDVPWLMQKKKPRTLDIALRSGDGTVILSFSAENPEDQLQPTFFRDALGRLVAMITREAPSSTRSSASSLPYSKRDGSAPVLAVLHGIHPRVTGQEPIFEREGCAFFPWARLYPTKQRDKLFASDDGGLGCFPVLGDGCGFSQAPELVMQLHGRGGVNSRQNQKCVASVRNEGLAIMSNEGKTFCFTSGMDLVAVVAAHIELSSYIRGWS